MKKYDNLFKESQKINIEETKKAFEKTPYEELQEKYKKLLQRYTIQNEELLRLKIELSKKEDEDDNSRSK